ncbi:trichohyalin-like isoform X3 [Mercenaria mercenaria]|uniref:trichohyalin-like isoform X3 n=1 Tax=Mercenaria mercenaria TaxID=6596 RepID=UPI00234FB46F|nr:trichohyalin-like isoform X3 [Mercenaria mercenaria]
MAAKGHSKQRLPNGYISNKGGHDAYDARDDFQTSPAYMTPNPKVLSVRVHVNRDKFEPGKKMVIAKHKLKTFENFLNECTDKCKPYFGSARRLYTARGRHRIQSLEELNQDSIYVITGNEQFEHVNYREIPDRPRQPRRKGFKKIDYERIIHPVTHAWDEKLRKEPGRSQDLNRHNIGLRLRVHKNGENTEAYHPVTILPRDKDNFSRIAEEISTAMGLPPIKQIYKIINLGGVRENFIPVTEAKELEQQEHLLVIPRTGFGKELNVKVYPFDGMNPFYVLTSPRIGPYWNYPSFQSDKPQTRHNRNLNPHKVVPSIGSSKQSDTMSPFSNPPGSQGERRGNKPKRGRGRREVDYDKDEGGVYRAKNQNNAKGAHQVNESRETRTEKPIDQTEAEIVEEEEIHSKEKTTPIPPGTELNKRPSKETKQNADGASQTKNKTEVKKGGKNGKDMNKLSVLPPIVDEGKKNGGANKVKKDEMKDIKEGVVKETVDKFEGNTGEGLGLDDPFSAEKESTPNDLKTDDVIEMTEREITPVDLKSSNVEVTKPPLSTTPPQGKLSKGSGKVQERVDEDAGMHRTNEFEDDSFNRYDRNTPGAMSKDPSSSTPASRAEERRKREQREYEAAAKIQAGARAYKARKEYKEKKEAQRRDMNNESDRLDDEARRREEEALRNEEEERRQENAHWQAEQDRQREEEEARWQAEQEREREMNAQKKKMDEDQAATRIQASFKGHKARKEYQAKKQTQVRVDDNKQSKSEKEIEAATKIQSGFRGYKVRKEYNSRKKQIKETDINDNEKKDIDDDNVGKKTMNEDDAAVAIQAGFKGYKTRKEFAQKKAQAKAENEESRVENKMDIDKKQHEAATQIQANFRGFRARKQYTEKKKNAKVEAESATRIQASFRGFRARKELSEKKKEPQLPDQAPSPKGDDEEAKNRAATKIQSGFRGYKARKDYKAKGQQ